MKLEEITLEEWAESSENYPNKVFFHTHEWLKILRQGFPHIKIRLYRILNDKNREIGLLPVELTRKVFLLASGAPLPGIFTPYQGPLLSDNNNILIEEIPELVNLLPKTHYFTLSIPPSNNEQWHINKGKLHWWIRKTLLIDLTVGIDQLWKNLKAETRNEVRQAERRGVEIYEPRALNEWIEDYYFMHKAVYLRQGIKPPATINLYRAIWDNLYRKGQLKVILAKYNNQTVAGGIFPIFKNIIYFIDGASLREYQYVRGNNLIQWSIISWAASEGIQFYDMVGANIPSIAHFKKGFGGAEVNYPYLQMSRGLLGQICYQLYQKYRPMLRRLRV